MIKPASAGFFAPLLDVFIYQTKKLDYIVNPFDA
jgi:hypothetical protein